MHKFPTENITEKERKEAAEQRCKDMEEIEANKEKLKTSAPMNPEIRAKLAGLFTNMNTQTLVLGLYGLQRMAKIMFVI